MSEGFKMRFPKEERHKKSSLQAARTVMQR